MIKIKQKDYVDYYPKYEWQGFCHYWVLIPNKALYDKLKVGCDYVIELHSPDIEPPTYDILIVNKYKNGKVLCYEY